MPYTEEQLIKLRGYYKSLVGQRELLANWFAVLNRFYPEARATVQPSCVMAHAC